MQQQQQQQKSIELKVITLWGMCEAKLCFCSCITQSRNEGGLQRYNFTYSELEY